MLDLLLVSLLDQIVLVSGPRNTGCPLTAGSQDHTSGYLMSGLYNWFHTSFWIRYLSGSFLTSTSLSVNTAFWSTWVAKWHQSWWTLIPLLTPGIVASAYSAYRWLVFSPGRLCLFLKRSCLVPWHNLEKKAVSPNLSLPNHSHLLHLAKRFPGCDPVTEMLETIVARTVVSRQMLVYSLCKTKPRSLQGCFGRKMLRLVQLVTRKIPPQL